MRRPRGPSSDGALDSGASRTLGSGFPWDTEGMVGYDTYLRGCGYQRDPATAELSMANIHVAEEVWVGKLRLSYK